MSSVVGIDLSTRALDLVRLDETTNAAEWVRCELEGKDAWERTLDIRTNGRSESAWWDDVYLVAIEAPYGSNQGGTQAKLNRVVGAIAASLPAHLRKPERCWIVRPDEYRKGLGLTHNKKPTADDLERIAGTRYPFTGSEFREPVNEHARDAYCLALWARTENAKGVAAAPTPTMRDEEEGVAAWPT